MRRIAVIALSLGLVGTSAVAQPLAPRHVPPKQPVRAVLEIPGRAPFAGELRVKFVDAARVRASDDGSLRSETGHDLAAVEALARELGLAFAPAIRLPATQLAAFEARAAARSGRAQPDLAGIVTVTMRGAASPPPFLLEEIGAALQALPVVEYAEIAALGVPPPGDLAPTSASFVALQTYRGPDPGMDADDAIARGFTGAGVRLSDCEYGWLTGHEDLVDIDTHPEPGQTVHPNVFSLGWEHHGTAVLGVTSAVVNAYGCSGMAPGAAVYTFPEWTVQQGLRRLTAVTNAIAQSQPGDVVLLEMQTGGAGGGYGPAELELSIWNVTKAGSDAGVVIVAAAGNGSQDLDSPPYQPYMARGDSGAIIVGAGSASTAHQMLGFSTFGSRVNVQGWGESVVTIGYGDLAFYGSDPNQSYAGFFNGTSSASPFVASASALLESAALDVFGQPLDPLALRDLLVATGRPQTGGGGHIGPFPDLHAALDRLLLDWQDLGFGLAGTHGVPTLVGTGSLHGGAPFGFEVANARQNALCIFFLGTTRIDAPLAGGILVPDPAVAVATFTDAAGGLSVAAEAPVGLAPGVSAYLQCWIQDPLGPKGAAATNAVTHVTP